MPSRFAVVVACLLPLCCAQQIGEAARARTAEAGDAWPGLVDAWTRAAGAQRASLSFLIEHMPAADFARVDAAQLERTVQLAHRARAAVAWGEQLPDELFHNYVLPYAQANETREDWREAMVRDFLPLVRGCRTPGEAARKLNETIFGIVDVHYSTARRRADQSPSESIAQGKASCTGLSILLADACRACCVPARLVSVRWPHKRGNHTWVEVFDGERWRFCGADEPDANGLDRAWFVGDAAKCADADEQHRIWAVSFADTGKRFRAGWGRDRFFGVDVTHRYAAGGDGGDEALVGQLRRYFAADERQQATFSFDLNLDAELKTVAGDARLRRLAWRALRQHEAPLLRSDHEARVVRAGGKQSPFTVRQVGDEPATGWPLVIAMHGGGGVAAAVNDSQWRHMQGYYRDHPEAGGYLYCALRAPTDEWNGFYTDYFYPVLERLIRQFVVCDGVDPDRVVAIGYSHGGYGAFAVGPKLPHRFAAVHASAAAPTDGQSVPDGLHSLRFSFMVGGKDTRYGRRARCEQFAAELAALQKQQPGRYPTKFTLVADNGHTGLPDRDLLAQLVPLRRTALPKSMCWRQTDGVVHDHYWLHVDAAASGRRLQATLDDDTLGLEGDDGAPVEAWLDARLVDLTRGLRVLPALVDEEPRYLQPRPSLRTLCRTMQLRGDPQLAASWVVRLP